MKNKITSSVARFPLVDQMRGLAILLMIYFHFSFDLAHFGFTESNFYRDAYWLNLRTVIVSMFLFVVGISLTLATRNGIQRKPFAKRIGLLIFFSALITLNSYFMFPGRIIIIGILHFILLASLLGLIFLRYYYLNLLLAILFIWLGAALQFTSFDNVWLHWIGMMTHKPITEDYVPLLPWFGVVLLGMFFGKSMFTIPELNRKMKIDIQFPPLNLLSIMGRHSLIIYILHQPILYGSTWLVYSLFFA